jgi:transposase
VDEDWLATRLKAGRSIESIARECERHPSTVAYWASKHGLVSQHAKRYAARGGVERERLEGLVEQGLSVRQIAAELALSPTSVRHWLRRFDLKTRPKRYWRRDEQRPEHVMRECRRHGWTAFRSASGARQYRCVVCAREAVAERRRRVKQMLVVEAGGCCLLCGYRRYPGALQFHHLDPASKLFEINGKGATRSLALLRGEARKCALLCANCHAEVEAGVTSLPYHVGEPAADTSGPG